MLLSSPHCLAEWHVRILGVVVVVVVVVFFFFPPPRSDHKKLAVNDSRG